MNSDMSDGDDCSQQQEAEQYFLQRKRVNWSLLHQGIALPSCLHSKIIPFLGVGEKRKITIILNGSYYDATLYNMNFNKEKYADHCAVLQIRYNPGSEIAQAFRQIFKASLSKFEVLRASSRKKEQAKSTVEEYIELRLSETENVFVIDCFAQNETPVVEDVEVGDELPLYVKAFQSLKRGGTPSGPAPHKLILLLAVIDCIENGSLQQNGIKITEQLLGSYNSVWKRYIPEQASLKCVLELPYYHLKNDGFWILKPMPGKADQLLSQRQVSTIAKLQETVEYAYVTNELYDLLNKTESREALKQVLVKQLTEQFGESLPVETVEHTSMDAPALAAEKSFQPEFNFEFRQETKARNKARNISLPAEVQVVCNYLKRKENKIFTIAELAEDEDIKSFFSGFAHPLKRIRLVITEHADETYAHFRKRKTPICFSRLSSKEWCLRTTFKNSFPLREKQSMNYSEWAAGLMRYFFPYGKKNENKHFFLCDGNVLCSIWIKNPLLAQDKDYDYIVSDFVAAVIKKAGSNEFMSFFLNDTDVKYRHLPFLCLQSLAWQYELPRLKRASNYYERLRGLLQWAATQKNISMPLIDGNLKSGHDSLWERFNVFVQKNGDGSIVLPSGDHDKHIAYSNLHSVFKREDSRRLYLYFAMQNIGNVRTMRDAKEIFYAVKKRENEVSVFNEDYNSLIGHCIKDYYAFWCSRFCGKTFDPFSSSKIKYAFFNVLGCAAYNENTTITEERGRELYCELQKKNRFLRNQEFRPGFLFYMNLARESWIENSCRFNWMSPEIIHQLSRFAQDNHLEEFSKKQAHDAYQTLELPYPWRDWMYADIADILKEKTVSTFQLDGDCFWQVLCGQNRIYPVLALENVDDTYCITQRGHHELQLQDDMRWVTQETLRGAGFNLRESMILVNKDQKWHKRIAPFAPKPYEPPHIYRVDYQEYADRVHFGEHLGIVETLLAVFPNTLSDNVQRMDLPQLQGCEFEPFRKVDPYDNYIAAILQIKDERVTWDSELLFASTPTPYMVFPSSRIRSQKLSVVIAEEGNSLPEIRNDVPAEWVCDDLPATEEQVKNMTYGLHTLRCILQSGKRLKKDVFVVPDDIGMSSCQIADWEWRYDLAEQESRLLEKKLLSASLVRNDEIIDCFFEMPEDAFFWWSYQIGGDYTINTPIHYSSLEDYQARIGLLRLVPDTTQTFYLSRDTKPLKPCRCSLDMLKKDLSSSLYELFFFGCKLSFKIKDQLIFTVDVIPSAGDRCSYPDIYSERLRDYIFRPTVDNPDRYWKVHPEQLLEALKHKDGCYIRGFWKDTEIFLANKTDQVWWFEKAGLLHSFMKKEEFKTLQEMQIYDLFIQPDAISLSIYSKGHLIERDITSVRMLYNAIQSHMDTLLHQSISIHLADIPIIEVEDVFADYSFILGKEFLLQNVAGSTALICQLSLNSIFFNELKTVVSEKSVEYLEEQFELNGTQYFLALDAPAGSMIPQNCDELLDIVEQKPARVRMSFCYEQMTYLNYSLHDVLHETETIENKVCNRSAAERRLLRLKNLKLFASEFFTDELVFADGLHEQDARFSSLLLREYNVEYFLRNGFENWLECRSFICQKITTFCKARISQDNEKVKPGRLYHECVYAFQGNILGSIRQLQLNELDDLIPCLDKKMYNLLQQLDFDKNLNVETKKNIKALLIAFSAMKNPPKVREQKCSLGYFFHNLIYVQKLTLEQQKYIHALYLTLLKHGLTFGD